MQGSPAKVLNGSPVADISYMLPEDFACSAVSSILTRHFKVSDDQVSHTNVHEAMLSASGHSL